MTKEARQLGLLARTATASVRRAVHRFFRLSLLKRKASKSRAK
jgi:hypothetical protein